LYFHIFQVLLLFLSEEEVVDVSIIKILFLFIFKKIELKNNNKLKYKISTIQ